MRAGADDIRPREPGVAGRRAAGQAKAGNARFVQDLSDPVALGAERRARLAGGQHPFAIVLSCADSRVPPEYVFNVGLGDLFVVRAAGEVVDRSVYETLFIGNRDPHAVGALIARVGDAPVLTIGESDTFTTRGGVIRVFMQDTRLRFEINMSQAGRAQLRISVRMLGLAKIVR